MSEHVQSQHVEHVLTITLSRPQRKNALDLAMYRALRAALEAAGRDDAVRVVVIQADGDTFCAGNDLQDFLQSPPDSESSPVVSFLHALTAFTKPLLVAVHGGAVGIGTTLLLHSDMAWATPESFFKTPFVQLGLVPEAASSALLPALVGHARAFEWLVLGDKVDAATAAQVGLINGVIPADALRAHVAAVAARVAALPPTSVRETKRLMRAARGTEVADAMARELGVFLERLRSAEAAEAIRAALERRPARF